MYRIFDRFLEILVETRPRPRPRPRPRQFRSDPAPAPAPAKYWTRSVHRYKIPELVPQASVQYPNDNPSAVSLSHTVRSPSHQSE